MKQLLILSGKGGTGKTTIASAFIRLSEAKAFADCDVDAPNLHLLMQQSSKPQESDYYGLPKAQIDPGLCLQCGSCQANCRFDAIDINHGEYQVDVYACEGCGVCEAICPAKAVSFKPIKAGRLLLYANDQVFSTAQLEMGSGNSGKLVTEVKKQMQDSAKDSRLAIIDGSPGIGCPVIASLSGVDMVLIVAEPSVSGISDMERILKTAEVFKTNVAVCINKYDINPEYSEQIEVFCQKNKIPFVGRIPFDPNAVKAINQGQTIVDLDCVSGRRVQEVFDRTKELLFTEGVRYYQ